MRDKRGGYPSGDASDPIPKPPTSAGPGARRRCTCNRVAEGAAFHTVACDLQAAVRSRCTCDDGYPDHAQHDPDCSLQNSGWLR